MKVEVHIDPQLTQTQVVIRAPARSPQVEQLVRQLDALAAPSAFTVFRDGEARRRPRSGKVCSLTTKNRHSAASRWAFWLALPFIFC